MASNEEEAIAAPLKTFLAHAEHLRRNTTTTTQQRLNLLEWREPLLLMHSIYLD